LYHNCAMSAKVYLAHKLKHDMDESTWIHELHAELEHKKRFLMMKDIRSLSVSVIEGHRLDDTWCQIKDYALDSTLKRDAPNLLERIEKIYDDYRRLSERLAAFIGYLHTLMD
jgi:hypothetical protein